MNVHAYKCHSCGDVNLQFSDKPKEFRLCMSVRNTDFSAHCGEYAVYIGTLMGCWYDSNGMLMKDGEFANAGTNATPDGRDQGPNQR